MGLFGPTKFTDDDGVEQTYNEAKGKLFENAKRELATAIVDKNAAAKTAALAKLTTNAQKPAEKRAAKASNDVHGKAA